MQTFLTWYRAPGQNIQYSNFFPGALNMKFHNLFYFKVFRENLISQLEVAVEILEL